MYSISFGKPAAVFGACLGLLLKEKLESQTLRCPVRILTAVYPVSALQVRARLRSDSYGNNAKDERASSISMSTFLPLGPISPSSV